MFLTKFYASLFKSLSYYCLKQSLALVDFASRKAYVTRIRSFLHSLQKQYFSFLKLV